MIQPVARIEIYKKIVIGENISYPSSPSFIIDEFVNLKITHGIERRKDAVTFNVINHKELSDDGSFTFSFDESTIQTKDLIKVFLYNAPLEDDISNHQVLVGYIKSYDFSSIEGKGIINFKAFNRTEVLLNSFMFAPYNEGEQVPNMIVDSIKKIRNLNVNDVVFAYKDYSGLSSPGSKGAYEITGIATTDIDAPTFGFIRAYKRGAYKSDGSGDLKDGTGGDPDYTTTVPSEFFFPVVPFVETYKAFILHLIDLSTTKYTEDDESGIYVSYIDNDNSLHWEPKSFDVEDIVFEGEDSKIALNKNNDETVNAVILNSGTDPNQTGILAFAFNSSSMGENGARWKYLAKVDIADEVKKNEIKSGDHDIDGESIAGIDNIGSSIAKDNYPDTYPWTIQTSGVDDFGGWTYVAGTTTVANDTEYKNYFRRVSKQIGKKRGESFVKYAGEVLYSGTRELENGNLTFSPNQVIDIVITSFNTIVSVRILSITHTLTAGRWATTLEIKEDIDLKTLGA